MASRLPRKQPKQSIIYQMTTDTPRTDACPHCGYAWRKSWGMWYCGTFEQTKGIIRNELCYERKARQKAEADREKCCRDGNQIADELFDTQLKLKASQAEVERLNRLLCDLLILTEKQYWNSNNYKQIKKAYHENK
jgi:hypothetical protein